MKENIKLKWLTDNGFTEDDAENKIGFHWESFTLSQLQRALSPIDKTQKNRVLEIGLEYVNNLCSPTVIQTEKGRDYHDCIWLKTTDNALSMCNNQLRYKSMTHSNGIWCNQSPSCKFFEVE